MWKSHDTVTVAFQSLFLFTYATITTSRGITDPYAVWGAYVWNTCPLQKSQCWCDLWNWCCRWVLVPEVLALIFVFFEAVLRFLFCLDSKNDWWVLYWCYFVLCLDFLEQFVYLFSILSLVMIWVLNWNIWFVHLKCLDLLKFLIIKTVLYIFFVISEIWFLQMVNFTDSWSIY